MFFSLSFLFPLFFSCILFMPSHIMSFLFLFLFCILHYY